MESWKGEINSPVVSICCITYNHESYVEDTLEGFLMQETDFPFEILIHDDASPDRTADVIRKYQERYPNIIKPIFQSENQYTQGIKPNLAYNYPRALGKYIALCDGDDYWTDKYKLKKQVEFLEEKKDYIATYHEVRIVNQDKEPHNTTLNLYNNPSGEFTIDDIENYRLPGQLSTIVYRNIWKDLDDEIKDMYSSCDTNGDRRLALMLILHGKIYSFSDTMSDYRFVLNKGTSWTARNLGNNLYLSKYQDLIKLEEFVTKAFGKKINFRKQRLNTFSNSFLYFVKRPNKRNWSIVKEIIQIRKDNLILCFLYLLLWLFSWPIRKIKRDI